MFSLLMKLQTLVSTLPDILEERLKEKGETKEVCGRNPDYCVSLIEDEMNSFFNEWKNFIRELVRAWGEK